MLVHQRPAQEGRRNLARQLLPLERRIALPRRRVGGTYREGLIRVEESQVRVIAGRHVALAEKPVAPRGILRAELGHAVVRQPALAALAEHAGEQVLGAAEAGLGEPDVIGTLGGDFHLRRAAGVIAHDPAHLALEHRAPQMLHVRSGADGRIDLGERSRGRAGVEEEVANRHLAAEVDVREYALHGEGRLHRLARR